MKSYHRVHDPFDGQKHSNFAPPGISYRHETNHAAIYHRKNAGTLGNGSLNNQPHIAHIHLI